MLGAIAGGEDPRHVGPLVVVHGDGARSPAHNASCPREGDVGRHAGGQQDEVSRELARIGVDVNHAPMLTFARLEHAVAQAQVHPVVFELLGQRQGHVQVDRREQVLSALDQPHLEPEAHQVLGHFQSDVSPTCDHGVPRLVLPHIGLQREGVLQHIEHEDAVEVEARNRRRPHRRRACCDHQAIIRLVALRPIWQLAHAHQPTRQVDGCGLVSQVHGDVLGCELLDRAGDEMLRVGHHAPDQIRQATLAVGGSSAAVEGHDLQIVMHERISTQAGAGRLDYWDCQLGYSSQEIYGEHSMAFKSCLTQLH